jgi:tryptophan synthase
MVRDARKLGLRAPILLMGYYNPLLSYGEERLMRDCNEAGVNGFIIVDLPPEEAISFRKFCTRGGYVTFPRCGGLPRVWTDNGFSPAFPTCL